MIPRITALLRRLRKKVSRSEWAARHIGTSKKGGDGGQEAGIILIQIDGLGYDQFIRALRRRRLPFLAKLLARDEHELHRFYSGLPSTTPAVQAELFFGVRCAVPAFHYVNRAEGDDRVMYDPEAVKKLAVTLEAHETGLLAGGSGYGNILIGGADQARFCIQGMDLQSIFPWRHPFRTALLVFIHLDSICRICGLALLETLLAVSDFIRGLINRRNIAKELRFIASRIGVCIVLRELLRLHVKLDIAAGIPIIHATFVGYDEHAHRRGPQSAFALWTLKGIDRVIRDIAGTAGRSDRRHYQVVIYSDHGQEAVLPFEKVRGEAIHQAIRRVFGNGPLAAYPVRSSEAGEPYANLHMRAVNLLKKAVRQGGETTEEKAVGVIRLAAMGPLGHLYLPVALSAVQMDEYASGLVLDGKIPYVLYNSDRPWLMTAQGKVDLRQVPASFAGQGHPFGALIREDLLRICLHQDAGDFVIGGWRQGQQPLSFPVENGAHGGPGCHETCGFLVIPDFLDRGVNCWRPAVLRKKIMACRQAAATMPFFPSPRPARAGRLRLLTYNIHSCIGLDGKVLPERISRIIGRLAPDIVCLQEVDRGMARSGGRDQAAELASRPGHATCLFATASGWLRRIWHSGSQPSALY